MKKGVSDAFLANGKKLILQKATLDRKIEAEMSYNKRLEIDPNNEVVLHNLSELKEN
jgi:hypothetical protein